MSKLPETVVLTGAARGIGFETAKILLPKGVKILGIARSQSSIEKAEEKLTALGEIHFIQGDVGKITTAISVREWVEGHWGKLDCLINNAGIQTYKTSILEEETEILEETMRVNVLGPHYFMKELIPLLKKGNQPRIINVSSGAGTIAATFNSTDMPSYRISKLTLNALTAAYSKALMGIIAVNSLDPGWLKTDLGGPNAPGEPQDGGKRIYELLSKPFSVTGKFWHGKKEINF